MTLNKIKLTEIELRLEKATHLINEIKSCENILDELFFSTPTISVAPPPIDFFHNYTDSAYDSIEQAKNAYSKKFDDNVPDSPTNQNVSTKENEITYPDNFGELIGQRIREKRNAIGLTQKDLAQLTGIKRPNIARLEKGQCLPNLNTLLKVSTSLHISVKELLVI